MSGGNCVRKESSKLEEVQVLSSLTKVIEKQGIVSILGSDCERTTKGGAESLRRTLSADMSSKKWLAQNGFRPMKKMASSEELAISTPAAHRHHHHSFSSSSSEDECDADKDEQLQRPCQDEIWRSIRSQKQKNEVEKPHGWTWGSILTQKNEESNETQQQQQQPPYIHPLDKRSSSLSEKSLEICTESLGSETGSDGFSSYPPSEAGDVDEEKEDEQPQQQQSDSQSQSLEDLQFVKYNYSPNRKTVPIRSFPPPLPSLAREDGASLHMQCHRQNGRLVLEAVSVPSQNYFHAQRHDGRLLLTLVNNPPSQDARNEEMEDELDGYAQVFDDIEEEIEADFEDDEYEIEEGEDDEEELMEERFEKENGKRPEMEFVLEHHTKYPSVINVHKSALVMKKLMALSNKNLTWSPKYNKAVNLLGVDEEEEEEEEEGLTTQLPQSLPPPPRVARLISTTAPPPTAASFNAYEYFWRQKSSVASVIKQVPPQQYCTPLKNNNNQDKAFQASNLKGYDNGQQNLAIMKRCNEQRRSLLLWEPCCIATS